MELKRSPAKITSSVAVSRGALSLSGQFEVATVNVDSKRPLDQLNGDHKFQVSAGFQNPPSYSLERPTGDTHGVARGYGRMRRERCVLGADAEGEHLLIIHRQRRRAVADYIDDAGGLHYREPLIGVETDKDISRKERMLDLPSNPILPSPDDRVER